MNLIDPRIASTNEQLAGQSRFACWELAKYLFGVNTGATAAMLLTLRSSPKDNLLLFSVSLFGAGTAAIILCIFIGTQHAVYISENFQNDVIALSLSTDEVILRHNKRSNHWRKKAVPCLALLSVIFLFAGATVAGFAFYRGVMPLQEPKQAPVINIQPQSITNMIVIPCLTTNHAR